MNKTILIIIPIFFVGLLGYALGFRSADSEQCEVKETPKPRVQIRNGDLVEHKLTGERCLVRDYYPCTRFACWGELPSETMICVFEDGKVEKVYESEYKIVQ